MRYPEEPIPERMEDKAYNEDRGFDEENPRRFYWVPLAFLALPLHGVLVRQERRAW